MVPRDDVRVRRYLDLLRTPGAAAFSLAGLVARLPLSMAGLGLVLLVEIRTDSYGVAGAVAAAYVVGNGVGALVQGRLSDRLGQRPVLLTAGGIHLAGMLAVLLAPDLGPLSHDAPFVWAVVAGLGAPQAGNLVRARWAHVLTRAPQSTGDDRRVAAERTRAIETAFALEAVLDEVVFIVGPVLVTVLTLQVAPISGLLVAALASTSASWALAAQRRTEPPAHRSSTTPVAALRYAFLIPVTGVAVGLGTLFGSTEVIVAAFTDEAGRRNLAGAVLAIWAGGSLIAGLVVGATSSGSDPLRRLRLASTGLTILFIPLLFVAGVPALAIGMLAAGLMIAPSVIALSRLIEIEVPAARLTEAFAWMTTGLSAGVSIGAAGAGQVVDARGASTGFVVPLVAGATAALVAWVAMRPRSSTA